ATSAEWSSGRRRAREAGVALEQSRSRGEQLARGEQQLEFLLRVDAPARARTCLPHAAEVAHPALAQILLGDLEAVVRALEHIEARLRARLAEEQAPGVLRSAADAPAQLVQLREPHALGALDDEHGRLGHVDADLDHGRRDEQPRLAALEALEPRGALGCFHA